MQTLFSLKDKGSYQFVYTETAETILQVVL